jgi:mutator protein MutT
MSDTLISPQQPDKEKPKKRIGVAVIYDRDGKILIDRRLPEGLMGGLWEFPGGKIEPEETPEECIKREILEELAIEVEVGSHLMTIAHEYSLFHVVLIVHLCYHLAGEPQPICCDEICWVEPQELFNFTFPEANLQIIETLQSLHKKFI